jgi:hypothetical protein
MRTEFFSSEVYSNRTLNLISKYGIFSMFYNVFNNLIMVLYKTNKEKENIERLLLIFLKQIDVVTPTFAESRLPNMAMPI